MWMKIGMKEISQGKTKDMREMTGETVERRDMKGGTGREAEIDTDMLKS